MSAEHFIEAHYYAGGLRHQAYGIPGSRPSWAPPADSVGFQDEFGLKNGDAAVETRRFEIGADRVTWIGIYYRSVDTKLGDRQNHAGVGVWIRNGIVTDVAALLYGLSNLAGFIAKSVDTAALGTHVDKFLETAFLPSYLQEIAKFPFARGVPYGPASMVSTQTYFVSCPMGVGECRALSDYLLNLMVYANDANLSPRCLILVSTNSRPPKSIRGMIEISDHFDVSSMVTTNLPLIFSEFSERAATAEMKAERLEAELSRLTSDTETIRREHGELSRFKDDPLATVLSRIDDLQDRIEYLMSSVASTSSQQVSSQPPIIMRTRPVTPSSSSRLQPEYEIDWANLVLLVLIVAVVAGLIFFAAYELIAWRSGS